MVSDGAVDAAAAGDDACAKRSLLGSSSMCRANVSFAFFSQVFFFQSSQMRQAPAFSIP